MRRDRRSAERRGNVAPGAWVGAGPAERTPSVRRHRSCPAGRENRRGSGSCERPRAPGGDDRQVGIRTTSFAERPPRSLRAVQRRPRASRRCVPGIPGADRWPAARRSGTNDHLAVTPVQMAVTPVQMAVTPVQMAVTPVQMAVTPVQMTHWPGARSEPTGARSERRPTVPAGPPRAGASRPAPRTTRLRPARGRRPRGP